MEASIQMDQALIKIGLPVKCRKCGEGGFVKPATDYGGWYKSQLFRMNHRKRWYCPEHHDIGKQIDDNFYQRYATPVPESKPVDIEEELYNILD